MRMKAFLKDEDGAVTTDWVVLTASIVGMGVVVLGAVASGASDLGESVGVQVAELAVGDTSPAELSTCSLTDAGQTTCSDGTSGLVD